MILHVEKILGGAIFSARFAEAPDRTEGIAILSSEEVKFFCDAVDCSIGFEKKDEMALVWQSLLAVVLIQTGTCLASKELLDNLVKYLRNPSSDGYWQLGEAMS